METGIGWKVVEELEPMAHGNSGILVPIFLLWKITKKDFYRELGEKVLSYENSLYDETIENWRDTRILPEENTGVGNVAWCHGAAGILKSRVECYLACKEIFSAETRKMFERDIERAYKKLNGYWKRDSFTLCHGICGNMWILEWSSKVLGKTIQSQEYVESIKKIYLK